MPVLEHARQTKSQTPSSETIAQFTQEEAKALFDKTANRYMGMSGEEFLIGWDRGNFRDAETKQRAMRVAMLIPLVRKISARKKSF